jgi:hypothetical protein
MGGLTLLEKLYNGRGVLLEKSYNIISPLPIFDPHETYYKVIFNLILVFVL